MDPSFHPPHDSQWGKESFIRGMTTSKPQPNSSDALLRLFLTEFVISHTCYSGREPRLFAIQKLQQRTKNAKILLSSNPIKATARFGGWIMKFLCVENVFQVVVFFFLHFFLQRFLAFCLKEKVTRKIIAPKWQPVWFTYSRRMT